MIAKVTEGGHLMRVNTAAECEVYSPRREYPDMVGNNANCVQAVGRVVLRPAKRRRAEGEIDVSGRRSRVIRARGDDVVSKDARLLPRQRLRSKSLKDKDVPVKHR